MVMDNQEVEEETWADKTWLIHQHRLVGRPTHTAIQAHATHMGHRQTPQLAHTL